MLFNLYLVSIHSFMLFDLSLDILQFFLFYNRIT